MDGERSDEERIAESLSMLPPAPSAWVEAASERPRVERGIEQVLALAEADAEFRQQLEADLETALRRAGLEPDPDVVRGLRAALKSA